MQTPHGDSAAVALAESPQRAVQGVNNIHHRRQQQTPPEGVAQVDKAALPRLRSAASFPPLRSTIRGHPQGASADGCDGAPVAVAVDAIGIPDRQRQRPQQLVKPYQPGGMPMDQLML